jgi:hypothetical protein
LMNRRQRTIDALAALPSGPLQAAFESAKIRAKAGYALRTHSATG